MSDMDEATRNLRSAVIYVKIAFGVCCVTIAVQIVHLIWLLTRL